MTDLAIYNAETEIYDKIISRITDMDLISAVIREIYTEISIDSRSGIFSDGDVPDIQEILVALNEENIETIEYFYGLCNEDQYISKAIEMYTDNVFPYLEDSIKVVLQNSGMPYRDTASNQRYIGTKQALECQNVFFN